MSNYNIAAIKDFATQWGVDKYDDVVMNAVMCLVNEKRMTVLRCFGMNLDYPSLLCRTAKGNHLLIRTHESSTKWSAWACSEDGWGYGRYVGHLTCMCCGSGKDITDDLLAYCHEHNIIQVFARRGGIWFEDDVTVDPGEDIFIA